MSSSSLLLAAAMLTTVTTSAGPLPLTMRQTAATASSPSSTGPHPDQARPSSAVRSRGAGPWTAHERSQRDAVVRALIDAEAAATESPLDADAALAAALDDFADIAPLVATDAEAQAARTYAQLAYARTELVRDDPSSAEQRMDQALSEARGAALPADGFGPDLEALHQRRHAALARRQPGRIAIECAQPCVAWVDERPFDPEGGPLPPGVHRVWVEARAAGQPVVRQQLRLAAGHTVVVRYQVVAPKTRGPTGPSDPPEPATRRRILPRWASVLGLSVGVTAAGTGGVLVGVDHRCPGLADPRTTPCLRILDTDAGGWTLVGLGTATAVASAIILALDETRARRHPARHADRVRPALAGRRRLSRP